MIALVFFTAFSVMGQTPGLIIKPATGTGTVLLDPDGDGYVSQKTAGQQVGFSTDDVLESEIPFVAIVKPDPLGDILSGPKGGFGEIVGTDAAGNNAILTYTDGINLYFRFRLGGFAPNSKSYSILIDTDQKFGFTGLDADPNAMVGNPGFEVEIVLKTNFSVDVYDINGKTSGTLVSSYSYDTNCQKSIALSTSGDPANPDYFYDFYVPYPSLFSSTTALRYVATTGMSPTPAMGSGSAADVGGVTSSGTGLDQIFADLINEQTPTLPGQEVLERSACPGINSPILTGATSVSGTSEYNGATIRLYVNDVQVGTTTVSGGSWTISSLLPLESDVAVKASAEAIGKGESSSSCNITFVGTSCTITPEAVSIENGNKGVRVTNVANYPVGTVFTLYNTATNMEWSSSGDNNPYTISTTDINNGSISIGCGGTGNCLNGGSYYIVARSPGKCESQKGYFCVDGGSLVSSTPVIDNPILPLSSYVTGINGVAGAILYVYANGIQIGSKTLTSSGSWSVPVLPGSLCNTTLTARQIAPLQCLSAISAPVTIASAITSIPTISIDKCNLSVTQVTGYSGESDGTIIQLYVDGVVRPGTATVTGGKWTFITSPITTGRTITARATNNLACKVQSEHSESVILLGKTTLTGSYSIPSTVVEGASAVSVDVTGVSGSYTLNLYIDGDKIGSKSFSGSGPVIVQVNDAHAIYSGGVLQVSLSEGSKCESELSPGLKTVECNTPDFTNSVLSAPMSDKCVATSGSITLTNSLSGVIYTPVDGSGNVKGYSVLGTGATITLTTHAFPTSGPATFYVKAQRIVASGTCEAMSSTSVSFNAFAPPQFTTHPASKMVCNGEGTQLTASWTGIGPFNVQWQVDNGAGFVDLEDGGVYSQTTLSGITATTASLAISNVSGLDNYTFRCIVSDTEVPADCRLSTSNASTLAVPIVTISDALVTNATLGNNGAIAITVSGGTGPYLFDWHHLNEPGSFGELEDLSGLSEGSYTVTVKDANNCTHEQTFDVGGVNSINLTLVSKMDVSCYGSANGSFTVSATDGTAPYSYSIDNFTSLPNTNGVFPNLSPGSYVVKARDAGSKTSNTVLVTITEPLEMVVSAVISNPSVLLNDGSIKFTIDGGTPNFTYSLYKVGTPVGTPDVLVSVHANVGNTITYSNLLEGTYYVNVKDANHCTASKTNIVLIAPTVETVDCSHTASHTFNDNSISGYDGDFNYFSSDWTESPISNEIAINEKALAFGSIPQSQSNTHFWNASRSIYREIDLQGATNIILSYKITMDGPSNKTSFTLQLVVNNVVIETYNANSFSSTTQAFTIDNISFKTISGNSVNRIEFRISEGQSRSNIRIDDFTLIFDKSLSAGVVATPSTCNNGKIYLSVNGGYPNYNGGLPVYFYDWDNDGTGDYNDTEDLTGLAPGTYKVSVKDIRNCTISDLTVEVGNAPLTASLAGSNDPTCVGGGSNGTVTATLNPGGLGNGGPYKYELFKGAAEIISTVVSAATSKTFTGLTAGTYFVRVTQAEDGCKAETGTVTLSLAEFSSKILFTGVSPSICGGSGTTVAVTIIGGTAPFEVLLSNGQRITSYSSGTAIVISPLTSTTFSVLSVTDALGCVSTSNTGSVEITVGAPLGSWTGAEDEDWNNPNNWACNQLPTLTTDVLIASGKPRYPLLSTGATDKARDITIQSGASVTVDRNTLQIAGAISNVGTFDATAGTIEMIGSAAQTVGGNAFEPDTLLNLIINNENGVTLDGPLNVTGVVSPLNGNLNSDGHLTLISTENQTALIDGEGAGNVVGNVNIQRYLPSSFGYKYISSPFQAATVAQLAQEVNLTEPFPTLYRYYENNNIDSSFRSGWVKYIHVDSLLIPMHGYAANLDPDKLPLTITMSGEVNNGVLSRTLYNHKQEYTQGFNLVGNPYPSPIDWDAPVGWTKEKIDGSIYFFNADTTDRYTGTYTSYVNGQATGTGDNIIAAMQGFFVHVTDGTASTTLGVTNAVRTHDLKPVFKSATIDPRPTLRLKAGFEIKKAVEDVALVYFDPTAQANFEPAKDALKLENTDEQVPNIYTLSEGRRLSINGLSEPLDSVFYIPVGITAYIDGMINFRAEKARELPFEQVYLSDAVTGQYHDLRQSPEVRFLLQRGVYDHRFKLVFSKAPFTGEYPGKEKLYKLVRTETQVLVKVNLPVGTKGNLMVTNVLGQSILRKEVSGKETVVINQKSVTGVYIITLVSGNKTVSEKILMRQDYE